MKNKIIKSIIFILIGIMPLYILNYLYINTNAYRSMDDTDKFSNVPYNIKVANFGSSHGMYDFRYGNAKDKFNFALSSQNFYYDYQILKQYGNHLAPGCIVLIPVSYFSYGMGQNELTKENMDIRYYRFLNYFSIVNCNLSDLVRHKFFPILSEEKKFEYLKNDKATIKNQWELYEKNKLDNNQLEETGKLRAEYHKKINKKENYSYNIQQLDNMIEYCLNHNFKPILLTTPYSKYYNQNFNSDFYNWFYGTTREICNKYKIEYWDYSHDERLTNNIQLFVDTDHLNKNGAALFTNIILDKISKQK